MRKQKEYEIGTLLGRWKKVPTPGAIDNGHISDRENGIIIDKIRMPGRYPIEHRYVIQWDDGEKQKMRPKSLKGYLKAGHIEILSEG
tara:strand:+ start:5283 stop:5543 length:261 start_codon:yes stop_codon:yes gene_type:complete